MEPTPESEGYTLHTCNHCQNSYKDNYTAKLPSATEPAPPVTTEPEVPSETTSPIEQPLTANASIGLEFYANAEGSGTRIVIRASASGGSGGYEYIIKVYRDGEYLGEQNSNAVSISPAKSGTYTAEVYVKDTSGNEVTITKSSTIST